MSKRVFSSLKRRTQGGWPPRFPIAQFPNPPLIVAFAAAIADRFTHGRADAFASSVFYVALGIWAYEEAARGVNWFRRLLGVVFLAYVIVKLALALDP